MDLKLENKINNNFAPIVYGTFYDTFVAAWFRYMMIAIYPLGAIVGILMAYGSVEGFKAAIAKGALDW